LDNLLAQGPYTLQAVQNDAAGNTSVSSPISFICYNTLPGDANGDGIVDFADFVILSQHFGQSTVNGPADGDFDFSGVVDFADFVILSQYFGKSVPLSPALGSPAMASPSVQSSSGSPAATTKGVIASPVAPDITPMTISVPSSGASVQMSAAVQPVSTNTPVVSTSKAISSVSSGGGTSAVVPAIVPVVSTKKTKAMVVTSSRGQGQRKFQGLTLNANQVLTW
jgi:hypothetical protein